MSKQAEFVSTSLNTELMLERLTLKGVMGFKTQKAQFK